MVYVIDDGLPLDEAAIMFVEGTSDFGRWFDEIFRPWALKHRTRLAEAFILGTAERMHFRGDLVVMPAAAFHRKAIKGNPASFEALPSPSEEHIA
jgi:hypothetical protein